MAPNTTESGSGRRFFECTEVSELCPVESTTLGYYPNAGINYFFAIAFGILMIATAVLGVWKKTWSFSAFVLAGLILEFVGYIGRIQLHDNPWNSDAFQTQICALILAPTLICISIYLTLKHVCLSINPALSRLRPRLYPFLFVPADVSCLLVQAIGGALAASAGSKGEHRDLLDGGNRAIIAGIALQVVVLGAFGAAMADYFVRARRWFAAGKATPEARALWADAKFRAFVVAVAVAYAAVLVRCVYRIAEMAGGWGSEIMQDEPSFIVLDGFMVLICVGLLTIFSPGIFFPQMAHRMSTRTNKSKKDKNGDDVEGASSAVEEDRQTEQTGRAQAEPEPKQEPQA